MALYLVAGRGSVTLAGRRLFAGEVVDMKAEPVGLLVRSGKLIKLPARIDVEPDFEMPDADAEPEPEPEPEQPPASEDDDGDDYSDMTNDELRDLLDARDLPTSGTKAELIARLSESDAGTE